MWGWHVLLAQSVWYSISYTNLGVFGGLCRIFLTYGIWYLPRIYSFRWRISLLDSRSLDIDKRYLTQYSAFRILIYFSFISIQSISEFKCFFEIIELHSYDSLQSRNLIRNDRVKTSARLFLISSYPALVCQFIIGVNVYIRIFHIM
jgi:hypothetical protein